MFFLNPGLSSIIKLHCCPEFWLARCSPDAVEHWKWRRCRCRCCCGCCCVWQEDWRLADKCLLWRLKMKMLHLYICFVLLCCVVQDGFFFIFFKTNTTENVQKHKTRGCCSCRCFFFLYSVLHHSGFTYFLFCFIWLVPVESFYGFILTLLRWTTSTGPWI